MPDTEAFEQPRGAILLREMTQVKLDEYQEPCNDQVEQWDDAMPENPAPKNDNTIFDHKTVRHVARE